MFNFLKEKLKKATSVFTRKIEKDIAEKETEKGAVKEDAGQRETHGQKAEGRRAEGQKADKEREEEPETAEKKYEEKREIKKWKEEPGEWAEEAFEEEPEIREEHIEEKHIEEKHIEEKRAAEGKTSDARTEKKGIFTRVTERITKRAISDSEFDEMFYDLEIVLMENSVAVEVIEKIKGDLKKKLVNQPLARMQISRIIHETLKQSINELFDVERIDLIKMVKSKKPFVIVFVGINGSGKTTTIAKIAKQLQGNSLSCVIAASDTFRAASIEQLQQHADNLKIKLIKHNYGADPAAVAFDAIAHAKAKNVDCVLIDTAGRMHSNANLLDEMKKIIRVAKPDLKLFVGEAITGNDCTEQAKRFNEAIGIDGIILAKADVDEKGGAAISIGYVTKKPILYLGTGQGYSDLKPFEPVLVIKSLGLEA